MKRTNWNKTVDRTPILALGLAMVLVTGLARAEEPASGPSSSTKTNSRHDPDVVSVLQGITQQAAAQKGENRIESADAILINNRIDFEWNRYFRTALQLPDWIDLGLENRTRFESYDHPWRASQVMGDGRTDPQIALRSRLRFGLGGNGPFRLLFEGQDARAYLNKDPGDFRDNTTVNEFDVLQPFGSFTANNVFGSGWRTDVHVGRMTMDFGHRRLIARNDFRNTSNAFDGLHWQLSQGQT
jgi:hypothetical protein